MGLTETLQSAENRFSWGPLKIIGMSMTSILMTIFGLGTYILDIYTDSNFGFTMLNSAKNNTFLGDAFFNCTDRFDKLMEAAINTCQSTRNCFGKQENLTVGIAILDAFRTADKQGGDCFETGDRFGDDTSKWITASMVTFGHLCLPILGSGLMWIVLMVKRGKCSIQYLPLPPITRVYQTYYDILLYKNEACNKLKKTFNEAKQTRINQYQFERERLLKMSHINASLVNMSIMFESSLEATFQES